MEIHDNLDKIGKLAEDDGLIGLTVELIDPQFDYYGTCHVEDGLVLKLLYQILKLFN